MQMVAPPLVCSSGVMPCLRACMPKSPLPARCEPGIFALAIMDTCDYRIL